MDPIAFKIGGFATAGTVFVAGGFLAGLWTASKRAALSGIDGKVVSDLGVWIIIAASLVPVLYVMTNWVNSPINRFQTGSIFVVEGWFFTAASSGCISCDPVHTDSWSAGWKIADAFAPSVPLGHALGRLLPHVWLLFWGDLHRRGRSSSRRIVLPSMRLAKRRAIRPFCACIRRRFILRC